jgi:NAD(P)H-dependent FMN reductase
MKSLLLLNGSPRGERSNSMKMLARVAEGWERAGGGRPETLHLARKADFDRAIAAFAATDVVLLGLPLYTDSMPALVKAYIEALAPRAVARAGGANPRFGFLVQSGFPEALHSRALERYLEKLARRLGAPYAGTIVRGGGESLQMMPDDANKKLWARLRALGEQLARDGRFGAEELKAIAGTERYSAPTAALLSLVTKLPIVQFYWNMKLKKNGAWERRFAAPYGPAF